jgi:DNA polymerase-3 subunit gamma/tau
VLQLLGAVEEEALFRLCDLVVEGDTAGALVFLEELSEQGQDLGRLVLDLLEHLRHLMLVQHTGGVPETLPVTEETRGRLREQANQLGPAVVVRLIDLLAVAVEDMRQGGDPRLPLELALVKVTRPGADLSRQSLSFRIEQLEGKVRGEPHHPPAAEAHAPAPAAAPAEPLPDLDLEQVQQVWGQAVLPAIGERSIPTASVLGEAKPIELSGNRLVIEFPPAASFHRNLAEEPKNATLLAEVLYEVTGHKLALAFAVGEGDSEEAVLEAEAPASEDDIISLMKTTFDAREVDE